jgi:hypothetical protein
LEEGVFEALRMKYVNFFPTLSHLSSSPNFLFRSPKTIAWLNATHVRLITPSLTCPVDISYPENNVQMELRKEDTTVVTQTKEEIKKSTVRLLRTLVTVGETLKNLPDDRTLSMALHYNDDAPEAYQPKFFRQGTNEVDLLFDSKPVKIKIGHVNSKYHTMELKLKTTVALFEDNSQKANSK